MGSRIYTREGDAGTTSLLDGTRLPKHSARLEAYGTLDEVCSLVGAARADAADSRLDRLLAFLQHRLMNCSSNLAAPARSGLDVPGVSREDVEILERGIDALESRTGAIEVFVLPGGTRCAALLHVARAACRRAERRIVALAGGEEVDPLVLAFVNRGSDLLFAAARYANHLGGVGDVAWERDLPRPGS